ncbi:MAG: hypothetical protein IPL32_18020 [Chloracidobacterium sp.]|nr:hypothetical protein [Chloracidobacterium sp.]
MTTFGNANEQVKPSTQANSRLVRGIIYVLEEWRVLTVVFERTFTSNMAATVPWIAPLIPASFALKNAAEKLHVQNGVEYIIAASIEGLGMSVTSTAFELWDWSDKNRDAKMSAPIRISIGTVVFYIVIVIAVNVGLDLGWADWVIRAMLSLLSIPAIVTLALRSQHSRRIAEQEAAKIAADLRELAQQEEKVRVDEISAEAQRKQLEFELEQKRLDAEARRVLKLERARAKTSITSESSSGSNGSSETSSETKPAFRTGRKPTHRDAVFNYIETYIQTHGGIPTFTEVEQELKLPQSTASRLRGEWLKERGNS